MGNRDRNLLRFDSLGTEKQMTVGLLYITINVHSRSGCCRQVNRDKGLAGTSLAAENCYLHLSAPVIMESGVDICQSLQLTVLIGLNIGLN